jgi:hypothetical protein
MLTAAWCSQVLAETTGFEQLNMKDFELMVMLEHVETPSSLRRALPMAKLTISMAILNSFLYVYQSVYNNGIFAGQKKTRYGSCGCIHPAFSQSSGWLAGFVRQQFSICWKPQKGCPFHFLF